MWPPTCSRASTSKVNFDGDVFGSAVIVFQTSAGNAAFVAQDFIQIAVELEDDFAFFNALHEFVHHDFFGAEAVAAVDQGNGVSDVGKVKGFLYGSIAAADDGLLSLPASKLTRPSIRLAG